MAIQLTGLQVQHLWDFCGGELDAEVTIDRLEARTSTDGEPMPAGLYAWFTEYPEEGCLFLPANEDEAKL